MSSFRDYVKDVLQWNEKLQEFLESEKVQKDNELWERLDHLTEIIEEVNGKDLNTEQLLRVQAKVDELHGKFEQYFSNRQSIGSVFINEPYVPAGKHTLPPLPYSFNALEPYISEEIMRLHYTKHHQSYVDGLNKAEKKLAEARRSGNFDEIKALSRELAFNGSGHYLHTIFWNNMKANGGGRPSGALLTEIEKYFGSFETFKKQFSEAAKKVEGPGWAILVWSPRSRHLEILQTDSHMLFTQWDTIPLLVLDVWEHAYYLQYKNKKAEYVDQWWNVVNWKDVEDRFRKASQLKWPPY
ncbi:superoxide dismutase [Bacillaceae bacterium Marseille-Q3522]|nr:superoxide dismutase [Bacillaceae bacterium Marseille-Q3522]